MPNLAPYFSSWLAIARANQLWFHGAHHLTDGPGFIADHVFYAEVYAAFEGVVDALSELAIAESLDAVVEPSAVMTEAAGYLAARPMLVGLGCDGIAKAALDVVTRFLATLQADVTRLAADKDTPIGLDDYLRSTAAAFTTTRYKLLRRVA